VNPANRLSSSRHRFGLVLGVAVALAAILIIASQISARDAESGSAESAARERPAASATSPFAGIPQHGDALGSPGAPVTLVEYADLQCPYCGEWARTTLPVLVERYVRTGKLRIVFNGLAFIGPDSDRALRTAVAAGRYNRLWDVVHALFERQGAENAGWVTDELIGEIAAGVPGLDGDSLLEERSTAAVDAKIARWATAAQIAGVTGTPSFRLGPTGVQLRPVRLRSLGPEGIEPAIQAAFAQ
jgi:protein-disulfide isomerase